jgi:hypothetical protein
MGKWISKITKPLTDYELLNEQRREIEAVEEEGLDDKTYLNVIFNILSAYLRHLSQFGVTLEKAKEIMLYFCGRYQLDKDRTQLILSELESTYTKEGITEKEKNAHELARIRELSEFLLNNSNMIILHYVSDYISDDATLTNILRLNKSCNKLLKPIIYRRCLLNNRENITVSKREFLWGYFLKLKDII